ncbi:hypothetical protein PMAYCL1PPCAC_10569 [Pristionchus mayeri]|uniref:Uncharacterized protein n=1 Tax=Pristionchus mayeri TaxID=1317129 RepID=A0AAN4ZIA7_9BILA|nr:hypothetical protein PMAYCL1PPCAC_10569 [Pristionchus mayeri]
MRRWTERKAAVDRTATVVGCALISQRDIGVVATVEGDNKGETDGGRALKNLLFFGIRAVRFTLSLAINANVARSTAECTSTLKLVLPHHAPVHQMKRAVEESVEEDARSLKCNKYKAVD